MFIDFVQIHVRAGKGGDGCISFRREKYIPKGGPDGGDGARGGHVLFLADANLHTLQDVVHQRIFKAENGGKGEGNNKSGKIGKDITIRVPVGTIIRNTETKKMIVDLAENQQEVILASGGKGGRGNARFATPTNRTPRRAEPGLPGDELYLDLELKVLADVGLVGLPNAGKSTLLASITAARPKIAGYPFTTLTPNLGIIKVSEYRSLVMADIPGLIEGAHEGKGLGIQFLKHVERTKVLAFMVDIQTEHPEKDYQVLKNELKYFNKELLKRPRIVLLTKADTVEKWPKKATMRDGTPILVISSVSRVGLDKMVKKLWALIEKEKSSHSKSV